MATYTSSIGRIGSVAPAWRAAMTATDTLYCVGTSTPNNAPALTGMPTQFGRSGAAPDIFGAGWDVMSGYSSGTLLEDVGGPAGMMVYGTGGHTRVQNQLLGFDLNQDDPTFSWWQPPTYKTTDTGGANLYWSPSESAALVAGPRGAAAFIDPSNETATAATWDRQFPVAFGGWIFPRKMTTGQMGDGANHGFRYSTTCYVPASLTGGDPMFLSINGPQGPFGQSWVPDRTNDSEWFDTSVLVNGARRWPYYMKNCRTGAWSVHQWQPSGFGIGSYGGPKIGIFRDTKRVYVLGGKTGVGGGYYYIDFSGGYSGHTVSDFVRLPGDFGAHRYTCGAFSDGDPLGRHFMVSVALSSANPETKLVVYDFDNNSSHYVDIAAAGFSCDGQDEWVGTSYDPINQRVLIVMQNKSTGRPFYWSITVPTTLRNAAGWVAIRRTPSLFDESIAARHFTNPQETAHFYGKTRLHQRLGVILVPFGYWRMLGFVPSV